MELHQISQEHLQECARLLVSVFMNPPWNESWTIELALQRLQNTYNTPEFYGVLAKEGEKIVGFALGHIEQYVQNKTFYLKEMCVDSNYQRNGIGTAIINRLQADLVGKGIVRIWLLTARDSSSESFYKNCGFNISPKIIPMVKSLHN